ncbi:MAG: LysE family translocator [Rhizobiaceae bacterium]|nr:LysE family translocator [Rhizobiaceae bacterium]
MTFELILAFNLALLAAIASPGPAFLMSIRTALTKGRAAGIRLGIGLGLMASIWTLAALLGLQSIFALVPWAYTAVKIAGAGYLLWIAYNTWNGATRPLDMHQTPAARDFIDGFLLNLSNPKSVLFAAAVLIVIFPPDLTLGEKAFIVTNHFLVEVVCYGLIAAVMSTPAMSKAYLAGKAWADRFASVVMGALGLRLLFQR